MLTKSVISLVLAATTITAIPTASKRQEVDGNFGLTLNSTFSSISYLQTYKLSYANYSAFVGEIKYELYSEPLVISGLYTGTDTVGGISFLSQHQTPTGYQYGYIVPGETTAFRFTVPHTGGVAPTGAALTSFEFSAGGVLMWSGRNHFYACQSPEQAAINTYQIWWKGGESFPAGLVCSNAPIELLESDPCARGS